MERAVAIKKLAKILGKDFGWQINMKAPDREARDEARAALPAAQAKRNELQKQKDDRFREIVKDAEYQRLKAEHEKASEAVKKLFGLIYTHRFTVGKTVGGMFFSVKAEGDSWEEVIAKLTQKQTA